MKRLLSILLVLAMAISMCTWVSYAVDYSDTAGHWGSAAIDRWSDAGVVQGTGDGNFDPDRFLTRAEAAQIFVNLLHLRDKADLSSYTDVPSDAWYADAIAKCVAAGILQGTGANTMDPTGWLCREQLFTMIGRTLSLGETFTSGQTFSDVDQVSDFAAGYVNTLVRYGVISGVGQNLLLPKGNCDRASAMVLLDRLIGAYITEDGPAETASSGITLIVADHVTLTGTPDGLPVVVAAAGAEVDLGELRAPAELIILTSGSSVYNAAEGTAVTAGENAYGTTVNGSSLDDGDTVIVSGQTAYVPSQSDFGLDRPNPGSKEPNQEPDKPNPDSYTRSDLETAIVEMAWDYYIKEGKIQYCSQDINRDFNKYYGATYRLTEDAPPEYGTSDTTIYSVCSDYVYKVYYEALGWRMFDAKGTLDAVTTIMWQMCEDVALMRWTNAGYQMTDEDMRFGATEEKVLSTADARAFLENWQDNLRPGDVLLPAGHAMLYIGGGYVVDCWGSKYGFKTNGLEAFEKAGSVHTLHTVEDLFLTGTDPVCKKSFLISDDATQDYFTVFRPLDLLVRDDGDADPGNDAVANAAFSVPDTMQSRLAYPAMEIDRTVDITPYGTAYTGESLTYTVQIRNCSNDPDYLTYHQNAVDSAYTGTAYQGLTVTETIPEGTELVPGSITHGGTYQNGVITWTVDLAAGASASLSYQVVVTAGIGGTIVNGGGSVAGIPSNSISNSVGGKKLSGTALNGLTALAGKNVSEWREQYNISRLGTDTEFAERVYAKAMNIGLDLPTVQEIVEHLFTFGEQTLVSDWKRESGTKTVSVFTRSDAVSPEYQTVADMVVGDYIGGSRVYFPQRGNTINEMRFDFLEPGDILVYADTDETGKVTSNQIAVFAGDRTLLVLTSDQRSSVLTGNTDSNSNPAFAKLWEAYTHHIFFVLRPSQAYLDVSSLPYDGSDEPSYGEEPVDPTQNNWGKVKLNAEHLAKLAAITAETAPTSHNTDFADDLYQSIGIDITSVTGELSAVNILKALFTISHPAEGYFYELSAVTAEENQRLRATLVTDLLGGANMVDYEDNRITVDQLEPGDILYLVHRTDSRYWVGVCLEKGKILFSEYCKDKYDQRGLYDFTGDSDGSRFEAMLAQADDTSWECYFVLRPYLGYEDINNSTTGANPGDSPYDDSADVKGPAYDTKLDEESKSGLLAQAERVEAHYSSVTSSHMAFAIEVYGQAGLAISDLLVYGDDSASTANLYNTLFRQTDKKYYLNPECTEAFAGALVPQLRGGLKMASATSIKTDFDYTDLEPGDILVQAVVGKAYYTSVYLGEGKLLTRQLHPSGIAYTQGGAKGESFRNTLTYDFSPAGQGPAFTDILNTDPQSGVSFDLFFVLRPCQTAENIEKLKKSGGSGAGGEESGSKPLSEDNQQKLLALAGRDHSSAWTKSNTSFAEEVYTAIGLDLNQILSGTTAANIRSNLFKKEGSLYIPNPASGAAYAAALVDTLWGGTKMGSSETVKTNFDYTDLEPGDLLYQIYATGSVYYVSVYLGEGKLLTCQYHKYGVEATKAGETAGTPFQSVLLYDFTDGSDTLSQILKTDPQSGKEFEYYFVLRPYLAVPDINSLVK